MAIDSTNGEPLGR